MKTRKRIGSLFDEFLKHDVDYGTARAFAVKRALAWQILQAMKEKHLAKAEMARRMETSRSQLDPRPAKTIPSIVHCSLCTSKTLVARRKTLKILSPLSCSLSELSAFDFAF